MSRLTWRQRLIAVAFGGIVAAVQLYGPSPKAARATAIVAPAASCSVKAAPRC